MILAAIPTAWPRSHVAIDVLLPSHDYPGLAHANVLAGNMLPCQKLAVDNIPCDPVRCGCAYLR